MSDYLIDFREKDKRELPKALALMKYFNDMEEFLFENDKFGLVLCRPDSMDIWGPYISVNNKMIVALAGRIAVEYSEWEDAKSITGTGGLACKIIYKRYREGGLKEIETLNGNYVILIYDESNNLFHIIIDRCGMVACFQFPDIDNPKFFCSHPDILASYMNVSQDWNYTSLAEFIITGKVTFPYTYYNRIKSAGYGSVLSLQLQPEDNILKTERKFFNFDFYIDKKMTQDNLAEELTESIKNAVRRRTHSIFGQSAISLSGGLDSRALLCSATDCMNMKAFSFSDEENYELETARQVAKSADVTFLPLKRGFDYYGENAELGVRISGATGNIFNNHYLGFRSEFKKFGIDNILAGFYLDRLFKGYVLNKKVNKLLNTKKIAEFNYESNQKFFWTNNKYANSVKDRLDKLFPDELKSNSSNEGRLIVEKRRIFPLYSESENPTTCIPQRVVGWFLPAIDNEIIDIYLKTPVDSKLSASSMYSKMMLKMCSNEVLNIHDANTASRINASPLEVLINRYKLLYKRRIHKRKGNISTIESWPDWNFYSRNSKVMHNIWNNNNEVTKNLFLEIAGNRYYHDNISDYPREELRIFIRLFTLKIWINQRC